MGLGAQYAPNSAPLPIQGNGRASTTPRSSFEEPGPLSSAHLRRETARKSPAVTVAAASPPSVVAAAKCTAAKPRPILKRKDAAKAGASARRPVMKFDSVLEKFVLFKKDTLVGDIKKLQVFHLEDTGDVTFSTLSKSLAMRELWMISSTNLPPVPGFGNKQIVLDSVKVEHGRTITGTVLVRNLSYDKSVTIHYTIDGWKTSHNIPATFQQVVSPASQNFVGLDKFGFRMDLNREFSSYTETAELDFALCYDVAGGQHWDNNQGRNYHVELRRPTADYVPSQPAHVNHPLFAWSDPGMETKRAPIRLPPPPSAPIAIPAGPRQLPKRHFEGADFLPVAAPVGHPVAAPVSLPLSADERRGLRAVSVARHSTLSMPWAKYSPPSTPQLSPQLPTSNRAPSPTSFPDAIETPFSVGSPSPIRRSTYTGISGLYAEADNFGPSFGCSPPGTPKTRHAAASSAPACFA